MRSETLQCGCVKVFNGRDPVWGFWSMPYRCEFHRRQVCECMAISGRMEECSMHPVPSHSCPSCGGTGRVPVTLVPESDGGD
jgi:hypothetical protein